MAAELITPTDPLTGIPLSIAPPLEFLPRNNGDIANWHHLWHPSTAPQLNTFGGIALRNSRVQLLPIHDHNTGKHNYHTVFVGPPLPDAHDEETQFRLCVLSCAGYLPDEVIDISDESPRVRPMTKPERALFLRQPIPQGVSWPDVQRYVKKFKDESPPGVKPPSPFCIRQLLQERNQRAASFSYNNFRYAYEPIRDFFRSYALKQRPDVKESMIDEFIYTTHQERRKYLGHLLLAKQSEVAADIVYAQYSEAYKEGLLHPLMPRHPAILVKYKLGSSEDREALFPELMQTLSAA